MEYKIVRMTNDTDLAKEINAKFAVGWEVTGGVSHSGQAYMQAMVRTAENTPIVKPVVKQAAIKKPSPKKRVKAGGTKK